MQLTVAIAKDLENQISGTGSQINLRDPEVFTRLVESNHRELLVYARALTRETSVAKDLVQDAFIVAYEKLGTFDVTRDFATWMRGIVRNKWREWIRKNKRLQFTDSQIAEMDADVAEWQAQSQLGNRLIFDALESCLKRLPDNLRETVEAFYYGDQTGEETAESLGVAPAAIRKRLQRARELLKNCVETKIQSASQSSGQP